MKIWLGTLVVAAVLVVGFGNVAVAQDGGAAWFGAIEPNFRAAQQAPKAEKSDQNKLDSEKAHEQEIRNAALAAYALGEINEHIKYDYQKAINYYRLAVQLAPDNREYRESLERFRRVCPLCK